MKMIIPTVLCVAALGLAACQDRAGSATRRAMAGPGQRMRWPAAARRLGGAGHPAYFHTTIGDRVLFAVDQSRCRRGRETDAERAGRVADRQPRVHGDRRRPCRRTGHAGIQPCAGRAAGRAAESYLVSQGVPPNRLRTVSYGKERPVEVCSSETCYAKNRRAVTVVAAGAGGLGDAARACPWRCRWASRARPPRRMPRRWPTCARTCRCSTSRCSAAAGTEHDRRARRVAVRRPHSGPDGRDRGRVAAPDSEDRRAGVPHRPGGRGRHTPDRRSGVPDLRTRARLPDRRAGRYPPLGGAEAAAPAAAPSAHPRATTRSWLWANRTISTGPRPRSTRASSSPRPVRLPISPKPIPVAR